MKSGRDILRALEGAPPGFGDWLRRKREACRLTVSALALEMGVSPLEVSDVEHGRLAPDAWGATPDRWCEALGIAPEDFVDAQARCEAEQEEWARANPEAMQWLRDNARRNR